MTTNAHNVPAVRTLSENDISIITKAYTALHGVLKDYVTAEEPLPEHFNPRSEKVQQIVAARAMHALKSLEAAIFCPSSTGPEKAGIGNPLIWPAMESG